MKKRILITTLMVGVLGLVGCGHKHTFSEATCTEPMICAECEETKGEALGHSWKEADCENAKTCEACGETEGEALGHTVDFGTCGNCNVSVDEDVLMEVIACLQNAMADMDEHGTYLDKTSEFSDLNKAYKNCNGMQQCIADAKAEFSKALDLLEGKDKTAEVRAMVGYLEKLVNSSPTQVPANDKDAMIQYLYEDQEFLFLYMDALESFSEFFKTLK